MDQNRRKQLISLTDKTCNNMIINVRQLRLSVLDLFSTLADNGPDLRENQALMENPLELSNGSNKSNANNKIYHQQMLSNLITSHQLCTASLPSYQIQKRQEEQQHLDLIRYVNQMISSITATIRSLDQDFAILSQNHQHISPGESIHLGLDGSLDKHNLYMDLCKSYKTYSNFQEYSNHCHTLLQQQSLRRVHKSLDQLPSTISNQQANSSNKRDSSTSSYSRADSIVARFNPYIYKILSHNSITSILDKFLTNRMYMSGVYSQPFGVSTGVFQISLNKVLKAILVMRGIVIDAVIVKAYHESFALKATSRPGSSAALLASLGETSNLSLQSSQSHPQANQAFVDPENDIDLWSESKYLVFRKLTYHANAAILHFQYPNCPELAVLSFLVSMLMIFICIYSLSRWRHSLFKHFHHWSSLHPYGSVCSTHVFHVV